MQDHKAAGRRDSKGGGGELPGGSRKQARQRRGRPQADPGKPFRSWEAGFGNIYHSVYLLKVDPLELLPKAAQP